MAGRILQQNSELFVEDGFWKLRWQTNAMAGNGLVERFWAKPVWIGPATGPQKMTQAEALEIACENFLSRLEQSAPEQRSSMTVLDFVESKFVPEHVAMKRLSGRTHYQAILKHVLTPEEIDQAFGIDAGMSRTRLKALPDWPYLTGMRLQDVRPEEIQRLITAALAHGYSTQTATHIRNAVRAVFAHAKRTHCFRGDNPADQVKLPGMIRNETHALTLAQSQEVLAEMRYPEREIALLTILTSMNVAEVCGLQWKHVNLAEEWLEADGEPIPPKTVAVRNQWSLNELDSLLNTSRQKNLPITEPLCSVLRGLNRRSKFTGPDDFVLVTQTGAPVDARHIVARRLRPIGEALQIPRLTWRVFRRTHTALAHELGMQEMAKASVELDRRPVMRGGRNHLQLSDHGQFRQTTPPMRLA